MRPSDILGGDVDPRRAARFMQNPERLASILKERKPGWDASPAEIVCDVVNVQRADTRALAEAHDVDVEMHLMDEDRAAELLSGVLDGDAVAVIEVFNELARKRDMILREVLDEEDYREFMRSKTSVMHTDDPETWEDREYDDSPDEVPGQDDVDEAIDDVELDGDEETVGDVQESIDSGSDDEPDLGVEELRENVESGTIEDTEWVHEAIDKTEDVDLLEDAQDLVYRNENLSEHLDERIADLEGADG